MMAATPVRRARTRAIPTPSAVVFREAFLRGLERRMRSEDLVTAAVEDFSHSLDHPSCTWLKAAAVRSASSPRCRAIERTNPRAKMLEAARFERLDLAD
jgi:hypothetical protein